MSNPQAVGYINEQGTFHGVYSHWGLSLDDDFDISLITDLGEGDDPFQVIDGLVEEGVEFSDIAMPRLIGDGTFSGARFIIEGFAAKINSTESFVKRASKRSATSTGTPEPEPGTPAATLREELRNLPFVGGFWILEKHDQEVIDSHVQEYRNLVDGEDWETLDDVGMETGYSGDELPEDVYVAYMLSEGGYYSQGYTIYYTQASI